MSEAGPRVFLDTNVLFSGIYSRSGTPARLLGAASREYDAVISAAVVDELTRNISLKAPALLPDLVAFILATPLTIIANPPPNTVEPWLAAGLAEDAMIVAAAVQAEVDYFCTGDAALLRSLATHEMPFRVRRPTELLAIISLSGLPASRRCTRTASWSC